MSEFNSDDHYIYYCGARIPQKKWISPHSQQNSPKCSIWMQSKNDRNDLSSFLRQNTQFHSNPSMPQPVMPKKLKLNSSMKTYQTFQNEHQKKDVLFISGDWNTKEGSQEISGVTGKFGLGVQSEAGQRLKSFTKRMHWSQKTLSSNNTRGDSTHAPSRNELRVVWDHRIQM